MILGCGPGSDTAIELRISLPRVPVQRDTPQPDQPRLATQQQRLAENCIQRVEHLAKCSTCEADLGLQSTERNEGSFRTPEWVGFQSRLVQWARPCTGPQREFSNR